MKRIKNAMHYGLFILILGVILVPDHEGHAFVAKESYDCNAEGNRANATTIEIKVAKKKYRKKKREIIKTIKGEDADLKVRVLFLPFLDPPLNLGIGKCVSAEDGRHAIKKAMKYNGGVDHVIMQEFMPHHWVKIGATDLAELTFIPITPDQLAQLSDPALDDAQFQALYLELSALKERVLPFGLGTRKIDVDRTK